MGEVMEAVVKFEPKAPIRNVGILRTLIDSRKAEIEARSPSRSINVDRLIKIALRSVGSTPALLRCTGESVLLGIMEAVELGLEPGGSLGEAWLVPFGKEASLVIGYQGLAKLARQTGEVTRIESEVVYENDHFVYRKGSEVRIEWSPAFTGDRGVVIGVYSLAVLNGGEVQAEFMRIEEIAKIEAFSKAKSGPWAEWKDEMRRKTGFRRLSKWLPLSSSPAWSRAIEISDAEFEIVPRAAASEDATDDLNARLGLAPASPSNDPGPSGAETVDVEVEEDTSSSEPDRITDKQMRRLHAAGKERGLNHEALSGRANLLFKVKSMNDLAEVEADELILIVESEPKK